MQIQTKIPCQNPRAEAKTAPVRRVVSSSLLPDFAQLAALTVEYGLSDKFYSLAGDNLANIVSVLNVNGEQAALLALILEHSGDSGASLETIAKAAKCGNIEALNFLTPLEMLEKRHLIRGSGSFLKALGSGVNRKWNVPMDALASIRAGKPYRYTVYNNLSPQDFFAASDELLGAYCDEQISKEYLQSEIKILFAANRNTAFVKGVKTLSLNIQTTVILLFFCGSLVVDNVEKLPEKAFKPVVSRLGMERLRRGDHELFAENLLEHDCDRGMADRERYRLTAKAKEIFLSDIDLKDKASGPQKSIIRADTITERKLFYPAKTAAQIAELTSLLREENFTAVIKRLEENNLRSGFACLFSGSPGTGKTETAYQIARETGRSIYLVDIAETKDKWFGESEKLIKAVFDRYHGMIKSMKPAPILLFNEADAILGKRQEIGSSRRGPAQTENAIQNIILQEMENLSGGILIATTNLTVNLDKAFERRFLYKIEFEKPDTASKRAIWQSHISGLSNDDADTLAHRFNFSGGQIENVARKHTISTMLHGGTSQTTELANLIALCETEPLERQSRPIGFGAE